jgi:hypothetical protein
VLTLILEAPGANIYVVITSLLYGETRILSEPRFGLTASSVTRLQCCSYKFTGTLTTKMLLASDHNNDSIILVDSLSTTSDVFVASPLVVAFAPKIFFAFEH